MRELTEHEVERIAKLAAQEALSEFLSNGGMPAIREAASNVAKEIVTDHRSGCSVANDLEQKLTTLENKATLAVWKLAVFCLLAGTAGGGFSGFIKGLVIELVGK